MDLLAGAFWDHSTNYPSSMTGPRVTWGLSLSQDRDSLSTERVFCWKYNDPPPQKQRRRDTTWKGVEEAD